MSDIQALHIAARRYCMDRAPETYVLEAILEGVERFVPEDFHTLAEARDMLARVGQTAENMFTEPPNTDASVKVMQEERDKFSRYVCTVSADELSTIKPLPYRRTLSDDEFYRLHAKLEDRWGVTRYWSPPSSMLPPTVILYFNADCYDDEVGDPVIRDILITHGITRIWELREYGPSYEIDTAMVEFCYNGAEGFWTSGEMDWVIYASHASYMIFAGEWLNTELQRAWPNWEQCVFTGWDQA